MSDPTELRTKTITPEDLRIPLERARAIATAIAELADLKEDDTTSQLARVIELETDSALVTLQHIKMAMIGAGVEQ